MFQACLPFGGVYEICNSKFSMMQIRSRDSQISKVILKVIRLN